MNFTFTFILIYVHFFSTESFQILRKFLDGRIFGIYIDLRLNSEVSLQYFKL